MPRLLRTWLLVIMGLDLFGLACVLLTWALAGGGEGGMGPYLRAVGRAAVSMPDLLVYCLCIAGYSAALEAGLRLLVQRPIARSKARLAHLAVPAAATAYALTHAVYHPAGVVYAGILGVGTALAYAWCRDWRALALWHVQWNALAIVGSLVLALWSDGDARTAMLFAYKADRIEAGTLVYAEGWGWVDRTHLPHDQLVPAEAWAAGPAGERLTLRANLSDILGGRTQVSRTYTLGSEVPDPTGRWATACAAVLDFHHHHERAQAERPWWTGTPLSAYQFDDLPSVLRACLDRRPGEEPIALQTEVEGLRARWDREGEARVREIARDLALPTAVVRARAHIEELRPPDGV